MLHAGLAVSGVIGLAIWALSYASEVNPQRIDNANSRLLMNATSYPMDLLSIVNCWREAPAHCVLSNINRH